MKVDINLGKFRRRRYRARKFGLKDKGRGRTISGHRSSEFSSGWTQRRLQVEQKPAEERADKDFEAR